MSRKPTPDETEALAKVLMECSSRFRRVTPQDEVSAATVDLWVHDDKDGSLLFRTEHKIPLLPGMGS